MEKIYRKFSNSKASDEADAARYRDMSPEQRLLEFFELLDQGINFKSHEGPTNNEQRLQRVYRIVKLPQR